MTDEIIPQKEKLYAKGLTLKEYQRQHYQTNKERLIKKSRTKEGKVDTMYRSQAQRSKKRNHPMPDYSKEDLRAWVFSCSNFDSLYQAWVNSGFDKMKAPSCDRLNDYKPYTLDNLRLVTWAENKESYCIDKKEGVNTKECHAVLQLTKEGAVVAYHHSIRHASRVTGAHRRHLTECCYGKIKSSSGFVWRFAADANENMRDAMVDKEEKV